ncbi:hypothetical protein AAH979_36190 [Plantactinospora sp. ZYX-F-223]|uniref:hypothetical protein n=1 Tax=Plantactinospora sp. ZYX-F-223 TaxID=3144103 RepID=UPI0031FCA822
MTTYRSRASVEAEAAHQMLAAHVPDVETGVCPICLVAGPCQPANTAANRLVELGLPVLPPTIPRPGRARLLAYVGPVLRAAPLLTFGWRRRLGLLDRDGAG